MQHGIGYDTWSLEQLVMESRHIEAIESGRSRYPIFRHLRFAARIEVEALFDRIALDGRWHAQRLNLREMLLDDDTVFVSAVGNRAGGYSSYSFNIWGAGIEQAEGMVKALLAHVGDARIREPMFSIDWHFVTAKGDLQSAEIEELADDVLLDEAYPSIDGGVTAFIERYVNSKEAVLVLQGPPGTGKTRLIRGILGALSRRKGDEKARALYTGDMKALGSDEIFLKFITGWDDAFVVEDADHLLKPRADGNEDLHRFLTVADGVVRAQGRKIIFSTNLPNIRDIDEALIRPGRCFARIGIRELVQQEAEALIRRLCRSRDADADAICERLFRGDRSRYALADIFRAVGAFDEGQ